MKQRKNNTIDDTYLTVEKVKSDKSSYHTMETTNTIDIIKIINN